MNFSIEPGLHRRTPVTHWLQDAQGRTLAFSAYPALNPWAEVFISHGYGEHRGWWHHVATALVMRGVNVYSFDHFHHGVSDGPNWDLESYDDMVAGFLLALRQGVAPLRHADLPLVLLAHSNGALISLLAQQHLHPGELSAMVLDNPMLGLPPLTRLGGNLLAALVLALKGNDGPTQPVLKSLSPRQLTSLRTIWADYGKDRFRPHYITPRYYAAMKVACRQAMTQTKSAVPVLLLTGGRDGVVNHANIRAWYAQLEAPAKHLVHYPALRHEVFNEVGWRSVLEDVLGWMAYMFAAERVPLAMAIGQVASGVRPRREAATKDRLQAAPPAPATPATAQPKSIAEKPVKKPAVKKPAPKKPTAKKTAKPKP